MRALCRWLARDRLPAYVSSFHKAALWCRRDAGARPAILVLPATIDRTEGLRLHVLGDDPALTCTMLDASSRTLNSVDRDGTYSVFELPPLGPWQPALCTAG
ncbi:MAG: hypothetical protein HYU36_12420 [Planctomycetes bacterium]|nr:hypothetical protein [Planctomycetota bacterium]